MNLKTITLSTLSFLTISALFFNSCRTRERDIDITEGKEAVLLERTNDDVISIVHQADQGQLANYGCATVTKNTGALPNTMVIDFGPGPCVSQDGKLRSGKILVSYEGNYADSGSRRIISFENYFVDTNAVKGTKTVETTKNSAGNLIVNINAQDTIIKKTGEVVTAIMERKREYTAGLNTAQWIDDAYTITGKGTGVRANGYNFTCIISKPLVVDFSCKTRIMSGEMQIQPQGKELRTLNFGDGTCDRDATIFINNKAYNIVFE
jgi:hypothetical protein